MERLIPKKLIKGDMVRVIAPSRSLKLLSQECIKIANYRFGSIGLKLSFGKHVKESDDFASSSIKSRVEDLHQAFADKKVKAIITVIGGFNSNQLLSYIDWELIRKNPKIFCGYSDITALNNAIFAKTGLVTYSGPHYSSFGQKLYFDYTLEHFQKCLFEQKPIVIKPAKKWSDDLWFLDQDNRKQISNRGYLVINKGAAQGTIIGANLCTLNLLQGTKYMPKLESTVLFIEDDSESAPHTFDRDLLSLIHQPNFHKVRAIVIGRFQKASKMSDKLLTQIIKTKKELYQIPIIANVDFGHTDPKITFPIGGTAKINATKKNIEISIIEH
jgi:muramoyltetrapeptide carboxypeptidase